MNNIINTPQNNQKNGLNPQFQSQQKKAMENNVYKKLVAQCNSKTIDEPKGVLLKNNGPIKGLAIGIADTGKDVVNLAHAIKDGKTNDHSLGRMNDLGLKVGGLGIAAYLMTKKGTKTGKMMEFVGLGTFLATMALWPRVFVDLPLRLRYGFNIRQKYEDSQGRKKQFFQDNQYLPWDLWPQKKIDKIGDKMGIPRNIKDRDSFTQRNMQKVALQGNTLWMLSAGFATPLITSMACRQTEKMLEKRNVEHQYKKMISTIESPETISKAAEIKAKLMRPFARIFDNFSAKGSGDGIWINKLIAAFSPIKNESALPDSDSAKILSNLADPTQAIGIDIRRAFNFERSIDEDAISSRLIEIFKNGIPTLDDAEQTAFSVLSEKEIKQIVKSAELEKSQNRFGEALTGAFSNFFKGRGYSLDTKTFSDSVAGIPSSSFMSIDEKPATAALSDTFDNVVRMVKAKLDIVQEAINATMGNRTESVTTQAYKQTMKDVLEFVNPSFEDLKAARESSEKAYELTLKGLQEIGQDDTKYKAFIKRLAGTGDSGSLLERLGGKVKGIFKGSKTTATPTQRVEETIRRVQENGYRALEESGAELRSRGFEGYAKLFDRGNPDGIFRSFDNAMDLARINLNSTRARYIMAVDFENKLKNSDFMENIKRIARDKNIDAEDYIDTCRKIIFCDNMNGLMVKNSMFDKATYYSIIDKLFSGELDKRTLDLFDELEGCEDLLKVVNETRSVMLETAKGAKYHPMRALFSHDDMMKVPGGQSQRYAFVGETIPDFFSKAANEAYKDKKWIRIFGSATLFLIGATLLTQMFFGRKNDKNLYEKKEKEVKNVNKQ